MNITIKDVPPELHSRLRNAAERSGRSLNRLILFTLQEAVAPRKLDRIELLDRIRHQRKALSVFLEDDDLEEAIQNGRQ